MSTSKRSRQGAAEGCTPPPNRELQKIIKEEMAKMLQEEVPNWVSQISDRVLLRLGEKDAGTSLPKQTVAGGGSRAPTVGIKIEEPAPPAQEFVYPSPSPFAKCFKCKEKGHAGYECQRYPRVDSGSSSSEDEEVDREDQQCSWCRFSGHSKRDCAVRIWRR